MTSFKRGREDAVALFTDGVRDVGVEDGEVVTSLQQVLGSHRSVISERCTKASAAIGEHTKAATAMAERAASKRWMKCKVRAAQSHCVRLEEQATQTTAEAARFERAARRLLTAAAKTVKRKRAKAEATGGMGGHGGSSGEVVPKPSRSVGVLTALQRIVAMQTGGSGGAAAAAGDVCDTCGVSMRVVSNDSMMACPKCGKVRVLPVHFQGMAGDGAEFVGGNHGVPQKNRFVEWLELSQGKEFAEPAPDVVAAVVAHLVRARATGLEEHGLTIARVRAAGGPFKDAADAVARLAPHIPCIEDKLAAVNATMVRKAMQALAADKRSGNSERLRKCYERSAKYAAYVSGLWPPRMTADQEQQLRCLFTTAAPVYNKFRKPTQPNWPGGYAYFLRCLCLLMGWDELAAAHFPLPPGQKNPQEREDLRRRIWGELKWEVVPCEAPFPPIRMHAADGPLVVVQEDADGARVWLDDDTTATTMDTT